MASKSLWFLCLISIVFYSDASIITTESSTQECSDVLPDCEQNKCSGPLEPYCKKTCNLCPVDCQYGEWIPWTRCSKTCDGGEKKRSREIIVQAKNGGKACGKKSKDTQICNNVFCPDMIEKLADFIKTDEEINRLKEEIKECKDMNEEFRSQIQTLSQQIVLMKNEYSADVRRLDAKDRTFAAKSVTDALSSRTALIENKPRFAAEIRSNGYIIWLEGDITGYDELIDVGNNFNPSTGVFTVEDEGTYVFLYSGRKNGDNGQEGRIYVYKNGNTVIQYDSEQDASHYLQMNSITASNLKKGDEIKLWNYFDDSIYVSSSRPFTFTGYKI